MSKGQEVSEYVAERGGSSLGSIFASLASACAVIAAHIRVAGLRDGYGAIESINVQGEVQQKLDVVANDVLIERLSLNKFIAALVSEENEFPILLSHIDGAYLLVFDPLDGSSNIDVNVNIGTIVSVVKKTSASVEGTLLSAGANQVAACYVLYGPSTMMVLTTGDGVASFVLNNDGRFVLVQSEIQVPQQGPYFSGNELSAPSWPDAFQAFHQDVAAGLVNNKSYAARYVGSLVADFHRTLLKGGIFVYPPTAKSPQGKLRLLYEAFPLAFIIEQADGAATDGGNRILDKSASGIHERTGLAIGSRVEVEYLRRIVHANARA
ncbi:MAG: fructose-1,6-bisphosphatase [Acidobacteriaceae bacterium]|nr:fructose-1,6-bisphosphatase [Acidobacteriaceae bacterium]